MNSYAKSLKVTGLVVIIFGLIGSFFIADALGDSYGSFNLPVFLTILFSSIFMSVLLFGLGEIINILDDNRKYLKELAGKAENSLTQEEEIKDELPDI